MAVMMVVMLVLVLVVVMVMPMVVIVMMVIMLVTVVMTVVMIVMMMVMVMMVAFFFKNHIYLRTLYPQFLSPLNHEFKFFVYTELRQLTSQIVFTYPEVYHGAEVHVSANACKAIIIKFCHYSERSFPVTWSMSMTITMVL